MRRELWIVIGSALGTLIAGLIAKHLEIIDPDAYIKGMMSGSVGGGLFAVILTE